MPVYMFECPKCGHVFEAYEQAIQEPPTYAPCHKCQTKSFRAFRLERAGLRPFQTYTTKSFPGKHPVRVESREQEKELCKKHGFERVK